LRKTLTLTLTSRASDFLHEQEAVLGGTMDPSAIINRLFQEEMKRQGFSAPSQNAGEDHSENHAGVSQPQTKKEEEVEALLENQLDEDIPAAG